MKDTCMLPGKASEDSRVIQAAEELAGLLAGTPVFQEFIRLSLAVRRDGQARDLIRRINRDPYPGFMEIEDESPEALRARLEALPLMRDLRETEQALRGLFTGVNQAISAGAESDFAENIRACGYG